MNPDHAEWIKWRAYRERFIGEEPGAAILVALRDYHRLVAAGEPLPTGKRVRAMHPLTNRYGLWPEYAN